MKAKSLAKVFGAAALICVAAAKAGAAERLPLEAVTSPEGTAYWFMPLRNAERTAVIVAWPSDLSIVPSGKEGAAFLATHLMMRGGAGGLDPRQVASAFRDLDAEARIMASPHAVRAMLAAPDETALEAAALLNTALRKPALGDRWLQRIRGNILKEQSRKRITAIHKKWTAARAAIMTDDRYRRALSFHPETVLTSLTRQDIVKWHKSAFSKQSAIIVAVGRSGSEMAGRMVDRLLDRLPARAAVPIEPAPYPQLRVPGKTIVLHDARSPKSSTVMVAPVPPATDRGGYKGMLVTDILGNSPQSRMFTELRGRLGLTYRVRVATTTFGNSQNVMTIGGEFDTGKLDQALEAMRETYRTFRQDGVTAEEFEIAKRAALRKLKKILREPKAMASFLIARRVGGHDVDYVAGLPSEIEALTRGELNRYIAKSLPPVDELLTVIVTPNADAVTSDCLVTSPQRAETC